MEADERNQVLLDVGDTFRDDSDSFEAFCAALIDGDLLFLGRTKGTTQVALDNIDEQNLVVTTNNSAAEFIEWRDEDGPYTPVWTSLDGLRRTLDLANAGEQPYFGMRAVDVLVAARGRNLNLFFGGRGIQILPDDVERILDRIGGRDPRRPEATVENELDRALLAGVSSSDLASLFLQSKIKVVYSDKQAGGLGPALFSRNVNGQTVKLYGVFSNSEHVKHFMMFDLKMTCETGEYSGAALVKVAKSVGKFEGVVVNPTTDDQIIAASEIEKAESKPT